jgi:response regulator RpfG family c-di-GMP phosphodiesterase
MRLAVLVLEDEPEVRGALVRDLAPLADDVRLEPAGDVEDARAALAEIAADGDVLAVVLADHRLPGTTGVDFLVELHAHGATAEVRKVLVTGQADQTDTIRAINEAGLVHYVAKPWDPQELIALTREQLTDFVLETGLDPLPHLRALQAERVLPLLRDRGDI